MPCPLPGDFPDPGIEPVSLTSPALACGFFIIGTNWEAHYRKYNSKKELIKEYYHFAK